MNDMLDTVKPLLGAIMDHYRVCIYSGHLDIIVALPLTEAMLRTVKWSGQDQYLAAQRQIW